MSLLEYDTIRKRWINKFVLKFKVDNNRKYKMEAIQNSAIYVKEADRPKLNYLVI